jgi:hypothetical protein
MASLTITGFLSIAGLLMSGVSTVLSYSASEKAAERAEKMGDANALLAQQETAEQMRRMNEEFEEQESRTKALMAATGASGESFDTYLDRMRKTFKSELDWTRRSGQQRAAIAKEGGQLQAQQYSSGKWSGFAGLADQAIGTYQTGADQGWWGGASTPTTYAFQPAGSMAANFNPGTPAGGWFGQ